MTLIKSISGIRGTIGGGAGEGLNPLDIVKFTSAYATLIRRTCKAKSNKIVVGRDARISGEMVKNVVVGTLMGMGWDVVDIDLASTPTTELAVTMEGACGGIILTASHNPKQWNALKLLNEHGEFLNAAEGNEVLRIAEAEEFDYADVDHLGSYRKDLGIFNSAVVPFGEGYAGVFRCDDTNRRMALHVGFSKDAVHWDINPEKLQFQCDIPEIGEWVYGYDPRVCFIDDRYYVTWCNGYKGQPTIGVAWTEDFKTFHQLENAFIPFNRNAVLFPRKIGGKFAMLSRPSDNGHTAFGDIFYSESPDMEFWGRHRHVMSPAAFEVSAWQCMKIGAGPVPIETSEGWLLFYHGVLRSCNGYVYAFGSALLDLDEPWKVTARSGPYLISPRETYECTGDVPNVTFPCAALHDPATGRVAVYYGCADTVTGLAFGYIPEIIDFTKKNNIL